MCLGKSVIKCCYSILIIYCVTIGMTIHLCFFKQFNRRKIVSKVNTQCCYIQVTKIGITREERKVK